MSNKRELKRNINKICTQLFAECAAASLTGGVAREVVDPIFVAILNIHADYTRRVSCPEPGLKPKAYYHAVTEELAKQVAEVTDQINELH